MPRLIQIGLAFVLGIIVAIVGNSTLDRNYSFEYNPTWEVAEQTDIPEIASEEGFGLARRTPAPTNYVGATFASEDDARAVGCDEVEPIATAISSPPQFRCTRDDAPFGGQ